MSRMTKAKPINLLTSVTAVCAGRYEVSYFLLCLFVDCAEPDHTRLAFKQHKCVQADFPITLQYKKKHTMQPWYIIINDPYDVNVGHTWEHTSFENAIIKRPNFVPISNHLFFAHALWPLFFYHTNSIQITMSTMMLGENISFFSSKNYTKSKTVIIRKNANLE